MLEEGLKSYARENERKHISGRGNSPYNGSEVRLHETLMGNSTWLSLLSRIR